MKKINGENGGNKWFNSIGDYKGVEVYGKYGWCIQCGPFLKYIPTGFGYVFDTPYCKEHNK